MGNTAFKKVKKLELVAKDNYNINKPYNLSDLSDKLLNCKVKDWELEFNAILSIHLA